MQDWASGFDLDVIKGTWSYVMAILTRLVSHWDSSRNLLHTAHGIGCAGHDIEVSYGWKRGVILRGNTRIVVFLLGLESIWTRRIRVQVARAESEAHKHECGLVPTNHPR